MNPELIQGGTYTDARGVVRFCNDFDMSAVKRFYTIANSAEQPVRGWIGHKKETKWFFPLKGVTIVETEPMDVNRVERIDRENVDGRVERVETCSGENGEDGRVERVETCRGENGVGGYADNSTCSARSPRSRYLLDVSDPAVLKVPPGNWFCIRQDGNAEVMVFSDCRIGEYENDDFRRQV